MNGNSNGQNETGRSKKLFYILIAVAVITVAALIGLVIVLLSDNSKPGNNTKEPKGTPAPTEEPYDGVIYTIKYTFSEFDYETNTYVTNQEVVTSTAKKPKERLTWSVSEVPELKKAEVRLETAEITFSNLPGWSVAWKHDERSLYKVGRYAVLNNGKEVFRYKQSTSYGALHFTDLNGDQQQEFLIVGTQQIDVFDFSTQKSCKLSGREGKTEYEYYWCEEQNEDVVFRELTESEDMHVYFDIAERGKLVLSGDTLEIQTIANPSSTDSIRKISSDHDSIECWFDYTKGDEEKRQQIILAYSAFKDMVLVADRGNFYYFYPNPDEYLSNHGVTDSAVFDEWTRWTNQCEKILNAYVTDLDGDDVIDICMTFQYCEDSVYKGITGLLIWSGRTQKITETEYNLRFVMENGKLVVKRSPVGSSQEKTLTIRKNEDDRFELSEN